MKKINQNWRFLFWSNWLIIYLHEHRFRITKKTPHTTLSI